ncbi:MAG: sulfate transporter [Gammaproteobacteria bacterium]|nr:sulfate transporter [Gammaproteobacteria bacterium]
MKKIFLFLFLIINVNSVYASDNNIVKLLSTTSTRDSGLYGYILPIFENEFNIKVYVIATGTGQALKNAQNCNGDLLITHATELESEFVKNGFGISRHNLMYNDFILVGPKHHSNNIKKSKNIIEAFNLISDNKEKFISRGDNSGTNISELNIWNKTNVDIQKYSGDWYLETGQGMGATLNIAIATDSFVYTDRSTWQKFNNKQEHVVVYENDPMMFNQYGVVQINPKHCNMTNYNYSNIFFKWITSKKGQELIRSYKLNGKSLFIPNFSE